MHLNFAARILGVVLALGALGCDDDNVTNPAQNNTGCALFGTSSINVSGGVTATVNSCTQFGVHEFTGGPRLVLTFQSSNGDDPDHTLMLSRQGARPGAGSFTLGSGADQFSGFFTVNTEPNRTFTVASGTLNISTSTATTLVGTLNLTGTEVVSSGTPATVTIAGSFTARCDDTSIYDC